MIRVVVDTNVLVSALLTEHGAAAAVLDFLNAGKLYWCISDAILADYLITGNKRHSPARWKSTKILNARELLGIPIEQIP